MMRALLIRQRQIIFFIIAGGLSAAVEILLMKAFSSFIPDFIPHERNWNGIAYPISNVLSTLLAILVNYWLSIRFVFEQGRHSRRREFTYFMAFSLLSTLLSLAFFNLLYHKVFLSPIGFGFYTLSPIMLSKAVAIIVVSLVNYSIKKRLVFNG